MEYLKVAPRPPSSEVTIPAILFRSRRLKTQCTVNESAKNDPESEQLDVFIPTLQAITKGGEGRSISLKQERLERWERGYEQ